MPARPIDASYALHLRRALRGLSQTASPLGKPLCNGHWALSGMVAGECDCWPPSLSTSESASARRSTYLSCTTRAKRS
jgi:hypothetical protein